MNLRNLTPLLITIIFISHPWVILADDNKCRTDFDACIEHVQDETQSLCSFIEKTMLERAETFNTLMQDAHGEKCPDYKEMEVTLSNIETQSRKYNNVIKNHLQQCKELSDRLINGLGNGGRIIFYKREGNYSLVDEYLDNWHQSFLNFRNNFNKNNLVDAMLGSRKIFYYESWLAGIIRSVLVVIKPLVFLVFLPLVLTTLLLFLLGYMGLIAKIGAIFDQPSTNFPQEQVSISDNSSWRNSPKAESSDENLRKRNTNQSIKHHPLSGNNENSLKPNSTDDSIPSKKPTSDSPNIVRIIWVVLFLTCLSIAIVWYTPAISFSSSQRYNWYPDATKTLDEMKTDAKYLQSTVDRQISSIEGLHKYTAVQKDENFRRNITILMNNLDDALRQPSEELFNVHALTKKMPSVIRGTYERIEAMAKKSGRLVEAKNLLNALNQTFVNYKNFENCMWNLTVREKKALPVLKSQTEYMVELVRMNKLVDIAPISLKHENIVLNISDDIQNVQYAVDGLLGTIGSDDMDGMKHAIKTMKSYASNNQRNVMLFGFTGTPISTVIGLVAMKKGIAIVLGTATVAAGPIAIGVGAGMVGLGAIWAKWNFDEYADAALFKHELNILDANRANFENDMNKLDRAIKEQQTAVKTIQSTLYMISTHSAVYSPIPGGNLNTTERQSLMSDLKKIIFQYNRMISLYETFNEHAPNDYPALSSD